MAQDSGDPAGRRGPQANAAKGRFPSGVTIVTGLTDDEPFGLTVSAFTPLGATMASVWILRSASVHPRLRASETFGVNVLGADQAALASRFASSGIDRFASTEWTPGQSGVPIFPGVAASMEVAIGERIDASDYTILLGTVLSAQAHDDVAPLVYWRGTFWDGGSLITAEVLDAR